MSKNQNLTPRDRVQIQGFQTLFMTRCLPDEEGRRMTTNEAFVTAIADTSDEVMDRMWQEKPEMIRRWLECYGCNSWRSGKRRMRS